MPDFTNLTNSGIKSGYEKIKEFHGTYLAKLGVKLPALNGLSKEQTGIKN